MEPRKSALRQRQAGRGAVDKPRWEMSEYSNKSVGIRAGALSFLRGALGKPCGSKPARGGRGWPGRSLIGRVQSPDSAYLVSILSRMIEASPRGLRIALHTYRNATGYRRKMARGWEGGAYLSLKPLIHLSKVTSP